MKEPFINQAHGWSGDDENTVNRAAIKLSLKHLRPPMIRSALRKLFTI